MTGAEAAAAPDDRRRFPWIGVAVVFLVAAALRGWLVLDHGGHYPLADRPVIDEAAYESWALEIAGGDWVGDEVFFQEPLYPYWMATVYAVFGPERGALRLVQVLLGAAAAAGVFALTWRVFGPLAAWVAGLGLALHRAAVFLPALLLKPNLFLPLLLAVGALLALGLAPPPRERGRAFRRSLGLGVLVGLGALLRGNMVLLTPLLIAWPALSAWRRDGPRRAAALAALAAVGVLAVLGPVALRNYAVGGVFAITTSGAGTNVYGGNNAQNPYGRATEFDWVRGIPEYEAADWKHEAERRTGRELSPTDVSSFWLGATLESMAADPGLHASIFWNKLRLSVGAYEVPDNHSVAWAARFLRPLRWTPGYALWGTLGLAGLLLFLFEWRTRRRAGGGLALALLYLLYLGTIVATVTSMRARLPLVPLLLPFAGYFVARCTAPDRHLPRTAVAGALAALCVLVPVFDADQLREDLDKRDFNLAVYLLQAGDLEGAGELAGELAARYPGTSRVETLLADVEARRAFELLDVEDRDGAQPLLQSALDRLRFVVEHPATNARERFRGSSVAGWIQLRLGSWGSAERRFREALAFDPAAEDLRLGLAQALHGQGRVDEALLELEQLEPTPAIVALIDELRGE